MYAMLQYNMF